MYEFRLLGPGCWIPNVKELQILRVQGVFVLSDFVFKTLRLFINHGPRARPKIKGVVMNRTFQVQFSLFAACVLLFLGAGCAHRASSPHDMIRVAVLPHYMEEGLDAGEGKAALHYRRTIGFINNHLVRNGFEVINTFAGEDSSLAPMEMCSKYGVDIAYIVRLEVKAKPVADNLCKAQARLDCQGYDSAGRNLGANVFKTFTATGKDCFDAIVEAEKNVGDEVGRTLAAWRGRSHGGTSGSRGRYDSGAVEGGVLKRGAVELENLIEVRLDGATEYELSEVFGKVINTVSGVTKTKRYSSQIDSDNPSACQVKWRVRIQDTDPFRMQANTIKMIKDLLDAGGEIMLNGVPYRYSAAEIALLKGIRPGAAGPHYVQFVIDREQVRDKEMQQGF